MRRRLPFLSSVPPGEPRRSASASVGRGRWSARRGSAVWAYGEGLDNAELPLVPQGQGVNLSPGI